MRLRAAQSDHEGCRFGSAVVVVVGLARVPPLGVACGLDLAEGCFAVLPQAIAGAALGDGPAFRVGQRVLGEGL